MPIRDEAMTALRYTSEPPTEDGWYWMRIYHYGYRESVVHIVFYNGDLILERHARGDVVELVSSLAKNGVQFAGPIPRPEE